MPSPHLTGSAGTSTDVIRIQYLRGTLSVFTPYETSRKELDMSGETRRTGIAKPCEILQNLKAHHKLCEDGPGAPKLYLGPPKRAQLEYWKDVSAPKLQSQQTTIFSMDAPRRYCGLLIRGTLDSPGLILLDRLT